MKLYAESVLIGTQWLSDRTIEWDQNGQIITVHEGKQNDAEVAQGPVIPGMVNCHSHAFQRAFAGLSEYRANEKDSFWSWRDIMYRFVARIRPQDAHHIASFLYLEMLKAGYTSVAEFHYLHHQPNGAHYDNPAEMSHQLIAAAQETGIAITLLPVLYTWAGFGEKLPVEGQRRFLHTTDNFLSLVDALNVEYKNNPLVKIGAAPHSLRAVSKPQLAELLPALRKLNANAPLHIHIAEQQAEVNDCLSYYGARPVEWLADNFGLEKNMCLIHATHLTDEERRQIARSEAVVGICPTTEANLGDGIFPTQEFLAEGGRIAIGSDSHISVNLADELRTLEYAQRLIKQQRAVLADSICPSVGTNVYCRAAIGGAQAIHQPVGEIRVGARADLVVLDKEHPSLIEREGDRLLDSALFAVAALPVKDVWVGGQQRIANGRHLKQASITDNYKLTLKSILTDS